MKIYIHSLILAGIFSFAAFTGFAQTPTILIDGNTINVSTSTQFPIWLTTGQTINIGSNVFSISAIEFNLSASGEMTVSSVEKINALYTVAANQTLKVEGVIFSPSAGGGNQWLIGGNAAPGSNVIGTTDNTPVSIQSGTGTLGVGADGFAKTINVGNTTGATTVNVNTGTGGYNVTTGAGANATTTLGTTGGAVFASSTGNADKIAIQPQTASAGSNTGTLTSADLTGAKTWTLPDVTGTLMLGTGTPNYNAYWGSANTISAEQFTSVVRGGLGADMTAGAVGAIPYATSTTAYGTLADVAAGSYLRSGGVGAAPVWSSITLPNTAATAGEIWYSSGTGAMTALPRHATQGTILMNNAGGTPSWSTLAALPATAGIIPPANLGTGTPGGATFLDGSGAWSVPTVTLSGGTVNALTYWPTATTLGATTTATPANGLYWNNTTGKLSIGIATAHASAMLDLTSTTKGFLPPRMNTSQRNAITTPSEGLVIFNTETKCLNFYTGSVWGSACAGVNATGGTITDIAGYRIHTFTSSGTFTVANGGNAEVLVVAGGGGTGYSEYHNGGAGGGGVVYSANKYIAAGTYSVTVGNGGTGGTSQASPAGTNGENSVFMDITANGGGRGGAYSVTPGGNGGSGGGGAENGNAASNVAGTATQTNSGGGTGYGNNGAVGFTGGQGAGGGGGAGGPGGVGVTNSRGGNGGVGYQSSISGVAAYYGGGGGGSCYYGNASSTGGAGGGGAGWPVTTNGAAGSANGTPNTGGGAGGYERANARTGGIGGSGIVIVRYAN